MPRLLHLLRSLGPSGAATNAGLLLEQRRREALLVQALDRAVARSTATRAPVRPAARLVRATAVDPSGSVSPHAA